MVSRHGRVSPVLGQPSGFRVPSGGCHPRIIAKLRASAGTELTLVTLHWAQRPWFSDLVQLSLAPPVILPSRLDLLRLTRSRHLYPDLSWLRLPAWRLQRFPKAAGFSSAIAEQSSLARHPSSRAVYQLRWSIYHRWCHSNGHSFSNPTLAMVADSCVAYGPPVALVCPPCVVTVQFYLRFSVFTFHPCLRIRCFGFCYAPSNSLQRSVCYVPILGTCLWCCLSSLTGLWPLSQAYFRALPLTTLFLLALATAKMGWGATGSLFHSHLCG